MALLFFPGVVLHELAHALLALILFVPLGKMEFMPQLTEDGLKLGSVRVGKVDMFRQLLVGMGPVLVGCSFFILMGYFLQDWLQLIFNTINFRGFIKVSLFVYGIFVFGNTMFSSKKDMEGAGEIGIMVLILLLLVYFFKIQLPVAFLMSFFERIPESLLQKTAFCLGIPIIIDSIVLVSLRMGRKY